MKKVLIIGFFWPYLGGSRRVIGLVKYLPEFGWEPIIVTAPLNERPDSQFRMIETSPFSTISSFLKQKLSLSPNRRIVEQIGIPISIIENKGSFTKKLISWVKGIVTYPDEYINWKPRALEVVEELLKKEKINAMISIWPVTSHLIAKELKNKHNIPWIADFPDPWSQNHFYPYGFIRKFFDEKLELKTLATADVMTAAAPLYKKRQENLHKKPTILITHGFDPKEINDPPVQLSSKFTITYVGTIYQGKQDPLKIFRALKNLIFKKIINQKDVEVIFYGPEAFWLQKEIERYRLSSIFKQCGIVSQKVSIKNEWASQLLLLLAWEDPREKGVFPGKFFEYLAAKRPILVTGGFKEDPLARLIHKTGVGIFCPSIENIEDALIKFYSEYKRDGSVAYQGDWAEIKKYSHKEMARKFATILDQIS